jgi:hypothetical protein
MLAAQQLVIHSGMLYSGWIPADPEAAAALLPKRLRPVEDRAVFMNQHVVDKDEQTSGFGASRRIRRGAPPSAAASAL